MFLFFENTMPGFVFSEIEACIIVRILSLPASRGHGSSPDLFWRGPGVRSPGRNMASKRVAGPPAEVLNPVEIRGWASEWPRPSRSTKTIRRSKHTPPNPASCMPWFSMNYEGLKIKDLSRETPTRLQREACGKPAIICPSMLRQLLAGVS